MWKPDVYMLETFVTVGTMFPTQQSEANISEKRSPYRAIACSYLEHVSEGEG